MEEKVPAGVAQGLLCPLLWVRPSCKEFGAWGRGGSHSGSWFGGATGIGAGGHLLPSGVSQEFGGREHKGTLPQTPIRRAAEVGDLEGLNVWNTQLVAGANCSAWGGWLWKVGMWGMGLFSPTKEGKWTMPDKEQPSGSTCTAMPSPEKLLATTRFHLCLPGCLGDTVWEDSGICPHPSVLGREGKSAYWRSTTPFGREHDRALRGNEVLPLLLWWGSILGYGSSRGNPHHSTWGGHAQNTQPAPVGTPMEKAVIEPTTEKRPPNQFVWLGESAPPLQAHGRYQRNSPLIERHEMKAL